MSPAGVLFVTFGALLLLGAPITVALGAAAMATLYAVDQNLVTMAHKTSSLLYSSSVFFKCTIFAVCPTAFRYLSIISAVAIFRLLVLIQG